MWYNEDCSELIKHFEEVLVILCIGYRYASTLAHLIARVSYSTPDSNEWDHTTLYFIAYILLGRSLIYESTFIL